MKVTRILLFASPILWFIPPLIPMPESPGSILLLYFYGRILRHFPWNLIMAGISYTYAQQIGREAFVWAGATIIAPFLVPLALAFRSPKLNSTADVIRRMQAGPARAKASAGSFVDRFPLLAQYLAGKPDSVWEGHRQRFDVVMTNYEFLLALDPAARIRMIAEASNRHFTTWMDDGQTEPSFYGAGIVEMKDLEETAKWLKGGAVSGGKLSIIWRQPDGVLKSLDYYAA
jgi:hypothetical protein